MTEQINALVALARDERDYTSEQFMQWFIKEQVEEVATMSDLLRVVERSQDDPMEIENYIAREHPAAGGRRPDGAAPRRRGLTVMELRTVRVAAVQATPVILDAEASVAKAVAPARGGGRARAPSSRCCPRRSCRCTRRTAGRRDAARFAGWDELWERLWANSVDVPGPLVDELGGVLRAARASTPSIGVNERETERPGSLYNTLLLLGPDGLLHKHRKLMPTQHERLFHGIGAGDDLRVVDTPVGRIGGLICWENRMPLARYAVYRRRPADLGRADRRRLRRLARPRCATSRSSRARSSSSAPQYIPGSAFPEDFPVPVDRDREVYGRGGAAIVEPTWGEVIAGPLYDERGDRSSRDCDLRAGLHAKRWFDAVGHYSREDVLAGVLGAGPPQ